MGVNTLKVSRIDEQCLIWRNTCGFPTNKVNFLVHSQLHFGEKEVLKYFYEGFKEMTFKKHKTIPHLKVSDHQSSVSTV